MPGKYRANTGQARDAQAFLPLPPCYTHRNAGHGGRYVHQRSDGAMRELLPLFRLARRVGLPQNWLREQADAGVIPCLKVGRRYLFEVTAAEEALAKLAAKTRQEAADERH